MLSNATLERASVAYRRGYRDGYDATSQGANVKPEYIKPFASFDYKEGFDAGQNDAKWDKINCPDCGHDCVHPRGK